jgi:hypothetical protein
MHIAPDGDPPPLKKLADLPTNAALGELLHATLRRDPAHRPTARAVRAKLSELAPELSRRAWPVA